MAQHDMIIDDQAGLAFLADLNAALAALVGNSSGATEPATMTAYMWWADTTSGWLKQRNAANSAWVNKMKLADATSTVGEALRVAVDAAAALSAIGARGTADDLTLAAGKVVIFEGATDDAFETTLTVSDPTADQTITLPNMTGQAKVQTRGTDIASAATINLTTATGDIVDVTGTTAITAITLADGLERQVRFTGALTLTNGASLILPGGANITTAAGDFAVFRGYAAGVVRCVSYTKANGQAVMSSGMAAGTAQATTSGTSIDFTGIPAGVKKITVALQGVSTNGTSSVGIQIGDSGGVETTGYSGTIHDFSTGTLLSGSGWFDNTAGSTVIREGAFEMTLIDPSTNTWACAYVIGFSHSGGARVGAGTKSLSATLDRVRLTTSGGSDSFDAGKVNIVYQ